MSLHRFGHDSKVVFMTVCSNLFHSSCNARAKPANVYILRFSKHRFKIPNIARSTGAALDFKHSFFRRYKVDFFYISMSVCVVLYG